MEKKWNLQDIKPAERRRSSSRRSTRDIAKPSEGDSSEGKQPSRKPRKKVGKGKLVIYGAILLAVLIIGLVFAVFNSGSEVTVFPRFREPNVNAVLEAKKQASSSELAYEVLSLEATGEREVTATGQEEVESQAQGVITIYKTTEGSERLVTNTRFRTSEGLVFRINDPVVVPGATADGPGTITAEVFADNVGEEYNIPANQRFDVPGFEESGMTELYEAIYAENSTEFTGGFAGPRFIIDEDQLETATQSLRTELETALRERLQNEKPAGFTVFDSAVTFVYRELPSEEVGSGQVKLVQKAILQIPIFKDEDFASFVAAATVPGYENEPVRVEDSSVFTFEYVNEINDINAEESISFRLVGRPLLVWTFDKTSLKKDLAGGSQTSLNTVLGGYPAIEKATATIRPFWKRSFPEDPEDITITESINKGAE